MKTIAIVGAIGAAVLAIGGTAWAAGNVYTHEGYGYCGWRNAAPAASHAPATQPDATGGTVHQHGCGHWWGWLVPGHRARCGTWNHAPHSGHRTNHSTRRGCW